MNVIECTQGSEAWWKARLGRPTASAFKRFVTTTGKLRTGEMPKTYAAELICESVGWVKDDFAGSPDIERGRELEAMARNKLAFEIGEDITEVGFLESDCKRYGGSPDGLAGEIPVELKCPNWHTHAKYLINGGGLPDDYKAQVHGQMILAGADYSWFSSFVVSPKIRPIIVKVERDEFTETLKRSVEEFCEQLTELKAKVLI